MRSRNPALTDRVFNDIRNYDLDLESSTMTAQGTVVKTMISLLLVMLTAGFTWFRSVEAGLPSVLPLMLGGLIVGALFSLATVFKPSWAAYTTPIYALAEGFFLGGLSAMVQAQFPQVQIVFQACALTFGTAFVMLVAYQTGLIRVTEKLRAGVMMATGAIALVYLVSFVMRFFGASIPFIHSAGPIGIGFSVVVVGIAAFNLLLDFDMIENLSRQRAPKHMEWYGAFALLVTLVWLYIEFLRLLSKLNRRN